MVTFLGTAGKINENDIDANAIKKSEILFLEGYLWMKEIQRKHLKKLLTINKVAINFDLFLGKNKPHFLN